MEATRMRRIAILVGLLLGVTVCTMAMTARKKAAEPEPSSLATLSCAALRPGDGDFTWTGPDGPRVVRTHLPTSAPKGKPLPMVIVLHGGGQKGGDIIEGLSRMNDAADANGFLAAYPTGSARGSWGGYTWNAGDCCGVAMDENKHDVGAISAMIDALTSGGCVDPKRVYVTGVSNGGIMSYRLACDLADKIAAAAPIAASLMDSSCNPSRPVSMYIMHGTADKFVNYEGGENWKKSGARRPFVSVRDSVAAWLKFDRCTGEPKQTYHKGDTTCTTHDQCAGGTAVTLCTVEGGGHSWPGGDTGGRVMLEMMIGKTTHDISNQHMWDFFAAHPMP
jgi:polyhydroxybutyrate depolymerase